MKSIAEKRASTIKYIVPNLRFKFKNHLEKYTDDQIAGVWEMFELSDDFQDEDKFLEWIRSMLTKAESIDQRRLLQEWGWKYKKHGVWKRKGLSMLRTEAVEYTNTHMHEFAKEEEEEDRKGQEEAEGVFHIFRCPHCGADIKAVKS